MFSFFSFFLSFQILHEATVMNDTEVPRTMQTQTSIRALLCILPCFFFFYMNSVMMFALLKKPFLLESPRYILFGHLLFTDTLQLLLTMLLYLFALTMVRVITAVCIIVTQLGAITVKVSPLNLAVMSLERYIAICFPLRHTTIVTCRRTGIAIIVMWTVASLDSFTQVFLFVNLENASFTTQRTCDRSTVYRQQVYVTLTRVFTYGNFVLVSVIIIYTYVAIIITAKSASSVSKANKSHKTVLLHLLQLCLCLVSTIFNMINSSNLLNLNSTVAVHIEYILFLCLILFPKCLSPLIYGLRDQTFRHAFKYYFTFGCTSSVRLYPMF